MSAFVAFVIGYIVGGLFGVLVMSILIGARIDRGGEDE